MTRAGALATCRAQAMAGTGRIRAEALRRSSDAFSRTRHPSLVTSLLFLSVMLTYLVSPTALVDLGFNYVGVGGSSIEKIHPATWIAILALICSAAERGNPLKLLDEIVAQKGLALFFVIWILTFIYSAFIEKAPATPLIDTFLLPMILFLLVNKAGENQKRSLARLVHLMMAANAFFGIYEYLTGFQLVPKSELTGEFASDWRSTALLGHPLTNAAMTGAYILALGTGGGRDIAALLRPLAIVLQLVAMVSFGGRASIVTTSILLFSVAMVRTAQILRGARLDILHLAALCFALPFAVTAGAAITEGGFLNQMLNRFVSDNGSASARVIMFKLFDVFPLRDIILGPDLATLASVQYLEGINYGIESFWISFIMINGLAIGLLFFVGLAAFCWDLVRVTRAATALLLFYFFAVASTSVSLSAKTCLFAVFVVLVLACMRRSDSGPALAEIR